MSTADRVLEKLESEYQSRPDGEGRHRSNSPLRATSNSMGFCIVVHDGEHGAYKDHVGGESGSLYQLADLLKIERPHNGAKPQTTKRGYSGLADYAKAHGAPADTFAAADWCETTYQERPALSFPTNTGTRYRFLDGSTPPFKSPPKYRACWYGLDRAVTLAGETGQPVVICNGEPSTIAAQYHRVSACAVTGGGERKIPDDLLTELQAKYSGPVIIAPDCDDKGRKMAATVLPQLRQAGFDANAVDLSGGKGFDLADFCYLWRTESVAALRDLPVQAELPKREAARPAEGDFAHTDLGNAERLIARHGTDLRYCHQWKKWLVWDRKRWHQDATAEVKRRAKETVRSIYSEAKRTLDDDQRKAIVKWGRSSEAEAKMRAMIQLADSEPGIPVVPEELDADPWLLNCQNGILNLRTCELLPHDPERLITNIAPVDFDPLARSDVWEYFLASTFEGDDEKIAFLQRAVGYSLTGDIREEVLFLVHGPGATGKSTFIEAVKKHLGDYAKTADFETFLTRRNVGGVRNDIARLAGARFVVSIEVDRGKKLAEGLIKVLTGGDMVTARFLFQESFEYRPQFKLWLAANHAPQISADDAAIWRRILRIPFEHVVPREKRDPKIKAVLKTPEHGAAILAWAVQGCLAWQHEGLNIPSTVEAATEAYLNENNPIRDFIADCCVLNPEISAQTGALRQSYETWAHENGEKAITSRQFAEHLKALGCESGRNHTLGRFWRGIGLRKKDEL